MPVYESDLTKFMRRFLTQHPEELDSQRAGRGIWWDKDPAARTAPSAARRTARAGGAEHTFRPLGETPGESDG